LCYVLGAAIRPQAIGAAILLQQQILSYTQNGTARFEK
jgi:hypothetical protein